MGLTYAPLPITSPGGSVELKPGRFLLEAHCSQSSPAETAVHEITTEAIKSLSNISALELARLINEPGEIINASFPRLSVLLTDANFSMNDKRIDDLYSQLQQVSSILQGLITDLIPNSDATEEPPTPLAVSESENCQADVPVDFAPQAGTENQPAPLRAMAMAA